MDDTEIYPYISQFHNTGVVVCKSQANKVSYSSVKKVKQFGGWMYIYIYVTRQAKGGQLSKSIFSHKFVNKLLNDTFINFISSQYMYFVKISLVNRGIVV